MRAAAVSGDGRDATTAGRAHATISSTLYDLRQSSALFSIAFAFSTSNFRARRNLWVRGGQNGRCQRPAVVLAWAAQCANTPGGQMVGDAPEQHRVVHALWDEPSLLLDLGTQLVEGLLLLRREVAQASRRGLVVRVGRLDLGLRCRLCGAHAVYVGGWVG